MKDDDSRGSNTTTIAIVAVLLLLILPCLALVGLLLLALLGIGWQVAPAPAQPPPVVRPEVKVEPGSTVVEPEAVEPAATKEGTP